jgi:4'-phosphopantetheinyl transferase
MREAGVNGIILSNHGGRQLDSVPSAIEVLPRILGKCPVPLLVDGGGRRGADILKAIALGGSAVLLGRAVLYGLAAYGESGASEVIALLRGRNQPDTGANRLCLRLRSDPRILVQPELSRTHSIEMATNPEAQNGSLDDLERSVHVWILDLRIPERMVAKLRPIPASEERERTEQFRFEALRHSFIIAHAMLRCLLGTYLKSDAASIRLQYGPNGKPTLAPPSYLDFNMTHSGNLAAFAFTSGCQLGLDLEQIRMVDELEGIASRFFCSEESAELLALAPERRERAFFLCWTRKEAYIKAIGDGLAAPLNNFRVTLQPDEPARFTHIRHDFNEAERWALHDLSLAPDYAAALAYRSRPSPVMVFSSENAVRLLTEHIELDQ